MAHLFLSAQQLVLRPVSRCFSSLFFVLIFVDVVVAFLFSSDVVLNILYYILERRLFAENIRYVLHIWYFPSFVVVALWSLSLFPLFVLHFRLVFDFLFFFSLFLFSFSRNRGCLFVGVGHNEDKERARYATCMWHGFNRKLLSRFQESDFVNSHATHCVKTLILELHMYRDLCHLCNVCILSK